MKSVYIILLVLSMLFMASGCSSDDKNIAEESLVALMDDLESNSNIDFEEVSVAYKADSICIIHAICEEKSQRRLEEYIMYCAPNGDDIFFTVNLEQQPSILSQFQTMKKQYKMTDKQYDQSIKRACVAYRDANMDFR